MKDFPGRNGNAAEIGGQLKSKGVLFMKLARYQAGEYHWKNGIKVVHTKSNQWTVYCGSGSVVYTGETLNSCKWYLYNRYGCAFQF